VNTTDWPELDHAERRVLEFALKHGTTRSADIAAALGYTGSYVRKMLMRLRKKFDVRENSMLLMTASGQRTERGPGQ
jgi:DNA-binding CsgD family transcriptional regulator